MGGLLRLLRAPALVVRNPGGSRGPRPLRLREMLVLWRLLLAPAIQGARLHRRSEDIDHDVLQAKSERDVIDASFIQHPWIERPEGLPGLPSFCGGRITMLRGAFC